MNTSTSPRYRRLPVLVCITLVLLVPVVACFYLPPVERPRPSEAVTPSAATRIAHLLAAANGDVRGIVIEDADLALTSRLDLIDAADVAVDVQYFIWKNDATGILVIERLLAAADRGVRVRALVDDVQLEGLVDRLSVIDDHPNIEIRVFNPFSVRLRYRLRVFRLAEFAIDGNRLNHRMHNKLMAADNQLAIIGGRNIGNDYFGRGARHFLDTDILLTGDVVRALSAGFDHYWNSRWAYPVNALVSLSLRPDDLNRLRQRIRTRLAEYPALEELTARSADSNVLASSNVFTQLADAPRHEWWATMIDDPDIRWFERPDEMAAELIGLALTAKRKLLVVSPYLIPTLPMLDVTRELKGRGVDVTVITNSLATNDVVIAQAAYSQFRRRILETGVALYEMRGDADHAVASAETISLHSKYMIIDDDVVFIGSPNLDPRSLYRNTELGVVMRSAQLASELRASFENLIHPDNAWRVSLTPEGVRWKSSAGILKTQPSRSRWQRIQHDFLSLIPVSSQL